MKNRIAYPKLISPLSFLRARIQRLKSLFRLDTAPPSDLTGRPGSDLLLHEVIYIGNVVRIFSALILVECLLYYWLADPVRQSKHLRGPCVIDDRRQIRYVRRYKVG